MIVIFIEAKMMGLFTLNDDYTNVKKIVTRETKTLKNYFVKLISGMESGLHPFVYPWVHKQIVFVWILIKSQKHLLIIC